MKIPFSFLLLLCAFATSVWGQKNKKTDSAPLLYHFEEGLKNVEINIDFPFPFTTQTQDGKQGTIYYVSAEDSARKTTYILNYTRHNTPLGRIEPLSLAETVFETFLIASESEILKKKTIQWNEIPAIQASTANKQKGMMYDYETFMYGNIQIQMMIARPYTSKPQEKHLAFFRSLTIK